MIEFLAKWFGATALILVTLSIDNVFWISGSGEDYKMYKKMSKRDKLSYIFHYRIKTVFTNWRDISASVIGGLILGLII